MIENVLFTVMLAVVGVAFGSFVNALVWRLRKQQEREEATALEKGSEVVKQVARRVKHAVTGTQDEGDDYSISRGRSMCPNCHHQLAARDLVPIFSWLWLRGKCRYCKKPISVQYPLVEIAVGTLFVISYLCWPDKLTYWYDWMDLAFWLAYVVLLAALFIYDLRWYILPDKLVWTLVGLALLQLAIHVIFAFDNTQRFDILQMAVYGLLPISGLYWVIYMFSRGRMVGFGDVKLGIFMGLVLGWQKALMALLFANLIGGIIVFPLLLLGKLKRDSRVPFGPMLIAAFFIAGLWGDQLILWYLAGHFSLLWFGL
ncbi:prepilin peptidase [Candidatus Saccharibacteria bacterium]|nr:prepilin peptidase [Candidatus Saccharibacteria bacterium]